MKSPFDKLLDKQIIEHLTYLGQESSEKKEVMTFTLDSEPDLVVEYRVRLQSNLDIKIEVDVSGQNIISITCRENEKKFWRRLKQYVLDAKRNNRADHEMRISRALKRL